MKKTKRQSSTKKREVVRRLRISPLVIALLIVGLLLSAVAMLPLHANGGEQKILAANEPFSIVALPDTQVYSQEYPKIFDAQTQWIVDNKQTKNIVFVTHLGDMVDNYNDEKQWQTAREAMGRLEGVVPYGIAPGNHDVHKNGDDPEFARYFPMRHVRPSDAFGSMSAQDFGALDSKNSYHLFGAGSMRFIAFNLEFCPPDSVLDWTDTILDRYSDRTAIIATHSFVNWTGNRDDGAGCKIYNAAGENGGTAIWNRLVVREKHFNILLFLNGHDIWSKHGAARHVDHMGGMPQYQLMSDYQTMPMGGSGYLRVMTFDPLRREIVVDTYSPYLDKHLKDGENAFTLKL